MMCGCGEDHMELDLWRRKWPMTETQLMQASQQASRCEKRQRRFEAQDKLRDQIANSGDC